MDDFYGHFWNIIFFYIPEAEHVSATEETPMIKLDSGGGETLHPDGTDEHGLLQGDDGGKTWLIH